MIEKYKNLSTTIKAGLWFTVCNVLQRGIQFIVTPIYTRLLTTDQYGVYSLFMTWMNIFVIFGTLNLSAGIYYNGIIKDDRDVDTYTSSLQVLSAVCSVITFSIILMINFFVPSLFNIPEKMLFLMFSYVLVFPAIGFWSAQNRVYYRYRPIIIITLISSILAPLVGIVLVKNTELGGYGVVIGLVSVNLIINGFLYIKNMIKGKFNVSIVDWKDTLSFSLPLIPHYLSQVVLGQFDRIMINYFWGESKAGIYTLAYQVGLILSILTSGINSAFTPWIYQQIKKNAYSDIRKVTNVLLLLIAIITAAITLVAPEIIGVLGTSEYSEAIWAIPPVMMSSFVTFAYCTFGTVLFYFEDTKRASFATTSGAVLNIILNAIFIPAMGYIAAGYTTLISYLLIFALYYFFMKKCYERENVGEIFDVKAAVLMTMLLIGFSAVSILLYKTLWVRYVIFALLLSVILLNRKKIMGTIKSIKG